MDKFLKRGSEGAAPAAKKARADEPAPPPAPASWAWTELADGAVLRLAPADGSLVAQHNTGLKTDAWETSIAHDFMGPYREPLTLKVKTHFA